jgi:hypothetical protein
VPAPTPNAAARRAEAPTSPVGCILHPSLRICGSISTTPKRKRGKEVKRGRKDRRNSQDLRPSYVRVRLQRLATLINWRREDRVYAAPSGSFSRACTLSDILAPSEQRAPSCLLRASATDGMRATKRKQARSCGTHTSTAIGLPTSWALDSTQCVCTPKLSTCKAGTARHGSIGADYGAFRNSLVVRLPPPSNSSNYPGRKRLRTSRIRVR